jgi:predicted nucleic acid-binding protein
VIIVADASPVIFLGKIRQLPLISRLLRGTILVPEVIADEIMASPISPAETRVLGKFLEKCRVLKVARPRSFAAALSRADNAALTLAVRKRADVLLADERLLRELAEIEGIRPFGTLGVLLRSMEKGYLPPSETRRLVDELIREHSFRISIEVYRAALDRIGRPGSSDSTC